MGSMLVKCNIASLTSCCFYAVFDLFFVCLFFVFFYPLNYTKMSLLKVSRLEYSAKTNTSRVTSKLVFRVFIFISGKDRKSVV